MKVALQSLRRMVHKSALAGKDDPSIAQGLWNILPTGPTPTSFETTYFLCRTRCEARESMRTQLPMAMKPTSAVSLSA